jgi:GntR family transcriptional regulator
MLTPVDPASPLPLYHQLAEGLRYRIATGALEPGTVLPSLRDAARQWRVNLHTVRHAYATLAAEGLVRTEAPRATVVLGRAQKVAGRRERGSKADRFLARMLREADERYGLTPADIRQRLTFLGAAMARPAEPVYLVECSETQAADLALQVGSRWNVAAEGWSLERPGEPPPGVVVATYFHYNDIRTRWPERFPAIRFVAIHPDPDLASRLGRVARRGRRVPVLVCEREAAMAGNIAADLRGVLPADRFDLAPTIESSPGAALAGAPRDIPVLFSPREWGGLEPAQRADPRAIEIRYLIDAKDLSFLGDELDWSPRALSPSPSRSAGRPPLRSARPASSS